MDGDPLILSFHNVCLRESDVSLLGGPFWLNDTLISFCFEYFRHVQFANNDNGRPKISFVTPDIVQLAKFYDTEALAPVVEALNWPDHELILFPVNDNSSSTEAGGTHWSLLVYRKMTDLFEHYDSSSGSPNYKVSVQVARVVHPIFSRQKKKTKIININSPQQKNGYDCGVYLIFFAECVARNFVSGRNSAPTFNHTTQNDFATYREKLKDLIESLKPK